MIPKLATANLDEDLNRIISTLTGNSNFDYEKNIDGEYSVDLGDSEVKLFIENVANESRIVLVCSKNDDWIVGYMRNFALDLSYRVFNPSLGTYLPRDPMLLDLVTSFVKPKLNEIIKNFGLEPVFILSGTMIVYAKDAEGKIHLINPHLLVYLDSWGFDYSVRDEFSYEVAPDLHRFVQYYDRRLIPTEFYEYFNRPLKIINDSGFSIINPGRKLFIRPYIMEIDNEDLDFFKMESNQGKLLYMDKIRNGETLDESIKRIIKELKIADDYHRAYVFRDIDFDRDKEDKIVPRLIVMVYVDKFQKVPEEAKRSWKSLEDVDIN